MQTSVYECVCVFDACESQRTILDVFEAGSLTGLELGDWAWLVGQQASGICLSLPL